MFSQDLRCLELNNIQTIDSWGLIYEDLKQHKVVLVGEAPHMVPANTYLQTEFLIYLNSNFGTKNMLIEWGHAEAYLINKYLQTGDVSYLGRTYYRFSKKKEAKEAFQKLYAYNKSLSLDKKVKFIGLDFEREPSLTSTIHFFLEEFQDQPKLTQLRNAVKARFDTIRYDMYPKEFLDYLRTELLKHFKTLSNSSDWPQIQDIVYFQSNFEDFRARDKYMFERFSQLSSSERYLGFFGTNHTRPKEPKVFAGLLKKDPKFHDEVLTINLHHHNSFYRPDKPINYSFLNDVGFFKKRYVEEYLSHFDSISDCDVFISKVEPITKGFQKLDEMCDYVIFIRNQMGYTKSED